MLNVRISMLTFNILQYIAIPLLKSAKYKLLCTINLIKISLLITIIENGLYLSCLMLTSFIINNKINKKKINNKINKRINNKININNKT